jgi:hypothetical protein
VLDMIPGAPRLATYSMSGVYRTSEVLTGVGLAVGLGNANGRLVIESGVLGSDDRKVLRVDRRDAPLITYKSPPKIQVSSSQGLVQHLSLPGPFAPRPQWAVANGGKLAFWSGSGSAIRLLSIEGKAAGSVSIPEATFRVAPADREAWVTQNFSPDAVLFGKPDPYRGLRESASKTVQFPERFPAAMRLLGDEPSGLWVLRAAAASGEVWSIIDSGVPARELIVPAGRELVALGRDFVVATARDADGIEIVEVYRKPIRTNPVQR